MHKPLLLASTFLLGGLGYKYYKSRNSTDFFEKNYIFDKNTAFQNPNPELYYKLKNRDQHLDQMLKRDKEFDLIIIGGGCNGAGVFLDGCARGLNCALIESGDFAGQTSSKSTKLIHGGMRYLQQVFEISLEGGRLTKFKLLKEALKERGMFVENAFYMNKQLATVIPTDNLFDTMFYNQSSSGFELPYIMGKQQLQNNFPNLDDEFKYGVVYYDGQFNDTRMNLDILFTGTQDGYKGIKGGNIINYAQVTNILKDQNGQTNGVVFTDKINKKEHKLQGKVVVNCTGVFADEVRKMDDPTCKQRIIPVGGSHMVMGKQFANKKFGILIPKTDDGRVLFILPWLDHSLIGTTESKYTKPVENPQVKFDEMLFMVQETSKLFTKCSVPSISNGIQTKWSGLRPLILNEGLDASDPGIDTKKVARNHVIEISKHNMISLLGGKWTVYRKMGEETVDKAIEIMRGENYQFFVIFQDKKLITEERRKSLIQNHPTMNLRLIGSLNKEQTYQLPKRRHYISFFAKNIKELYNLDLATSKYLIRNYGDRAFDLMKLTNENPILIQKIHKNHKFIKAEIIYQIRYEMAQSPIDSIYRRFRLGFLDRSATMESLETIIDLYASELKWDKSYKKFQLQKLKKEVQELNF